MKWQSSNNIISPLASNEMIQNFLSNLFTKFCQIIMYNFDDKFNLK